ncbi:BREX protein BrxB domain-containing protein [Spirosoma linguale]|uniref:Cytoplasmic protein n=1 Tax=Spirosoma linguale (strain ATCC 33905 / DSM 74 / LMG 10896 / Claus 1) TaxID=504472 RepID=D2QQP0_SPILD|nr:hypothetical protein Slin_4843 [Spirosoma linguale DSM 74]
MTGQFDQLYHKLTEVTFQDPATGNLFFPVYLFTYTPTEEYSVREQISALGERLLRPYGQNEVLVLNLFDAFLDYLRADDYGDETLLDILLDKERQEGYLGDIDELLRKKAGEEEFISFVAHRIRTYLNLPSQFPRVFVLLHGFGSLFPLLRVSTFLNKFERHVVGFKLIVFYPGTYQHQRYVLFNQLHDEHLYRAIHLNALL